MSPQLRSELFFQKHWSPHATQGELDGMEMEGKDNYDDKSQQSSIVLHDGQQD